ncbi:MULTISPECIES: FUSC family protein [Bradyrhizobium]|uniref:FUSC family protein n=1 Tax=Bradyrhizobium arachidis TaxID=858423 RepID=A0AAE7NTH5_9BRAD|nr:MULTISPECIES: FUSC family protein [Bradyrhizobium]QOG18701.1 FUSC family protein [Bradyrhizobium sp. SEMIA]QOZ70877.1 FUSC family protein [Bradyrhizobium arachidis]UFW47315.1 FUSC family protein [Bradyrhizobium arachidis]SFU96572.1 Fusaric acid resistance protein-like [Bradyrhizobium arachidis]
MNSPTIPSAAGLRGLLAREVKSAELVRALIVVGPMVAAYFIARETALLNLGLVAVSLLIPALRQHFPPKVVAWHYLAILVTFAVLFFAAPVKPLFVVLTALAGFLAVAGTRYGEHFRTLGNWVFIPAVYLACEVREGVSASEALRHAGVIIVSSPIALALVCAIQLYDQRRGGTAATSFGPPAAEWFLAALATAMAVFAAAALVEILNLAQGQWVMWSAASVVVGDLTASTGKLKQRAIGAVVGVPLGFLAGLALPQSRVGYAIAVLAATLTLISFSRYVVGFGLRCFFIALAASFAGGASGIAEERIVNVLIGGTFGLIAVALTEIVWLRMMRKA